jgi:hypothetical protein
LLSPNSEDTGTALMWSYFGGVTPLGKDLDTARLSAENKAQVIRALAARTGLPKPDVHQAIRVWAESSNDKSVTSLAFQQLAAEEFGVELSEWQQKQFKSALDRRMDSTASGVKPVNWGAITFPFERIGAPALTREWPSDAKEKTRKFLRAMYENTQEELERRSIDSVKIYRGVKARKSLAGADVRAGDVVALRSNALESWSIDKGVARSFARRTSGAVLETVVPRERVLGFPRTGWGSTRELEIVILGNVSGDTVRINETP